jgi:hypothetical protein
MVQLVDSTVLGVLPIHKFYLLYNILQVLDAQLGLLHVKVPFLDNSDEVRRAKCVSDQKYPQWGLTLLSKRFHGLAFGSRVNPAEIVLELVRERNSELRGRGSVQYRRV